MKLYSSFVTAKAGTEEYTMALHALAEALGMTAQEADNAGDSIKNLAIKKMEQAVADARTAIQIYNNNQSGNWLPKSYTANFGEYSKDLINIVQKYEELFEMSDRDVAIFDTSVSLDKLISQYRAAEDMQAELRLFADKNNINLTNFTPYLTIHNYLTQTNAQYQAAISLMESYANAAANLQLRTMPEYEDMEKLMSRIADGGEVSTSTLQEYANVWDNLIS